MKEILLVAVLYMAIASCSPPKYTYYFDRYSAKIPTSYKAKDAVSEWTSITSETTTANSSIPIQEQSLLASASNGVHVTPNKKTIVVEKDFKTSLLEIRKTDRRKLVQSVREFKRKIEPPEPGDKSKNWAATTGFILSLASLFFFPLLIPAIIFSAIGLKSEKRKLAIAGMVIGLAVLVALLVMYAMFASG